jgi:hypothetical protein
MSEAVPDIAHVVGVATAAPTKLLIAVHGVGDQAGYETVQSVATRVGAYYGVAPAMPLGRFYPVPGAGQAIMPSPQLMVDPPDPRPFAALKLGFAEVYWAPIARDVVAKGYILEHARKWMRTISARVAAHGIRNRGWGRRDVERLVTVLDELVHTVFVLERLTYVADKAGLFTFDLAKLLVDFAGDVQIVADFDSYRHQILAKFDEVMTASLKLTPDTTANTELYIVAHSEGSVVAFLSLLHALHDPRAYPWITRVRGLMTIGSPIEIHHLLWPGLWCERRPPLPALTPSPQLTGQCVIQWHNYIDDGDPIAYELKATTEWLGKTGFATHLQMTEMTYSRSYLPGKAHVDYWRDEAVFGHFIEKVVHPNHVEHGRYFGRPRDRRLARSICWLVPQVALASILMLAVYVLYTPVAAALGVSPTPIGVGRDVSGIALLLLGVTAAARIPRIMDHQGWWVLSAVLLVAAMLFYANVTCPATQLQLGRPLAELTSLPDLPIRVDSIADRVPGCTAMTEGVSSESSALALVILAGLVAAISGIVVHLNPRRGDLVLPAAGLIAMLGLIVRILYLRGEEPRAQIWPVVIAAIAFFYLWWLTALLFDLTFVWQHYVRESAASDRLEWLASKSQKWVV